MSKYISKFNETGNSVADIELVCKDWSNKFSINLWKDEFDVDRYTLIIKDELKTLISKEQALELIDKLNLIKLESAILKSSASFHTSKFILSEYCRLNKIKAKKVKELALINRVLDSYPLVQVNDYLKIKLKSAWKKCGYSDKKIERVFESIEDTKSEVWTDVPDYEFLNCVKHLTHPELESYFTDPEYISNLKEDINSGVTFAFYIKEGKLYWER